jgi:two-component sensor histidine kinase
MAQINPPHVLYIDDDEGVRRLVQKALTKNGFEVSLAHDGYEGLALLKKHRFSAIGLDHFLPGHDGFDVFEMLNQQADCPPIVYVTGSEDINLAIQALRVGASDFVIKDVEGHFLALLGRAFAAAIDRDRLKREKEQAEQDMREANARLAQLNAKQTIMLREMNHRIGNSLQLITSMIRMQSMSTQDKEARQVLQQAIERVIAVSQVHQRLYTSDDILFVQMRPYINQILSDHRITAEAQECSLLIDAVDCRLETDQAIAIGIIVTELVTNSLRHAYPGGNGPIRVFLKTPDAATCQLIVEDDGIGLQPAHRSSAIGAKIIDGMAKRLKSKLDIEARDIGTRLIVTFPISTPQSEESAA